MKTLKHHVSSMQLKDLIYSLRPINDTFFSSILILFSYNFEAEIPGKQVQNFAGSVCTKKLQRR